MSETHPNQHLCQTEQWADFKQEYGNKAVKAGQIWFFLTKLPLLKLYAGYCPKADQKIINWQEVYSKAKSTRCVFVKIEFNNLVNADKDSKNQIPKELNIKKGQPVFSSQTILVDISKTEDELLKNTNPKTRYNINLARKRGVKVVEGKSEEDLREFIKLQKHTAKRQGFYVHPDRYYQLLWKELAPLGMAKLLIAKVSGKTAATFLLFKHQNVLYYPYGASDYRFRATMAANLLMWEALRWGKKNGCTLFDMWGATTNQKDPWWGFTRFKLGYGGKIVSFEPTVDLVIRPFWYTLFRIANWVRWFVLNTAI